MADLEFNFATNVQGVVADIATSMEKLRSALATAESTGGAAIGAKAIQDLERLNETVGEVGKSIQGRLREALNSGDIGTPKFVTGFKDYIAEVNRGVNNLASSIPDALRKSLGEDTIKGILGRPFATIQEQIQSFKRELASVGKLDPARLGQITQLSRAVGTAQSTQASQALPAYQGQEFTATLRRQAEDLGHRITNLDNQVDAAAAGIGEVNTAARGAARKIEQAGLRFADSFVGFDIKPINDAIKKGVEGATKLAQGLYSIPGMSGAGQSTIFSYTPKTKGPDGAVNPPELNRVTDERRLTDIADQQASRMPRYTPALQSELSSYQSRETGEDVQRRAAATETAAAQQELQRQNKRTRDGEEIDRARTQADAADIARELRRTRGGEEIDRARTQANAEEVARENRRTRSGEEIDRAHTQADAAEIARESRRTRSGEEIERARTQADAAEAAREGRRTRSGEEIERARTQADAAETARESRRTRSGEEIERARTQADAAETAREGRRTRSGEEIERARTQADAAETARESRRTRSGEEIERARTQANAAEVAREAKRVRPGEELERAQTQASAAETARESRRTRSGEEIERAQTQADAAETARESRRTRSGEEIERARTQADAAEVARESRRTRSGEEIERARVQADAAEVARESRRTRSGEEIERARVQADAAEVARESRRTRSGEEIERARVQADAAETAREAKRTRSGEELERAQTQANAAETAREARRTRSGEEIDRARTQADAAETAREARRTRSGEEIDRARTQADAAETAREAKRTRSGEEVDRARTQADAAETAREARRTRSGEELERARTQADAAETAREARRTRSGEEVERAETQANAAEAARESRRTRSGEEIQRAQTQADAAELARNLRRTRDGEQVQRAQSIADRQEEQRENARRALAGDPGVQQVGKTPFYNVDGNPGVRNSVGINTDLTDAELLRFSAAVRAATPAVAGVATTSTEAQTAERIFAERLRATPNMANLAQLNSTMETESGQIVPAFREFGQYVQRGAEIFRRVGDGLEPLGTGAEEVHRAMTALAGVLRREDEEISRSQPRGIGQAFGQGLFGRGFGQQNGNVPSLQEGLGNLAGTAGTLARYQAGNQALYAVSSQLGQIWSDTLRYQDTLVELQAAQEGANAGQIDLNQSFQSGIEFGLDASDSMEIATRALQTYSSAIRGGADASEIMAQQTRAVAESVLLTGQTAQVAQRQLNTINQGFGLGEKGQGADRINDSITNAANFFGGNKADIQDAVARSASSARLAGMSPEQTANVAALIGSQTGNTGGQISSDIERLVSRAGGGDFQAVLARFKVPNTGDFLSEIQELTTKIKARPRLEQQQIVNQLGANRNLEGLTALIAKSDQLPAAGEYQTEHQGQAAEDAAKRVKTLHGELQKLGAEFSNMATQIGTSGIFTPLGVAIKLLEPGIHLVNDFFSAWNRLFDHLPKGVKGTVTSIAELAAVMLLLRRAGIGLSDIPGRIAGNVKPRVKRVLLGPEAAAQGAQDEANTANTATTNANSAATDQNSAASQRQAAVIGEVTAATEREDVAIDAATAGIVEQTSAIEANTAARRVQAMGPMFGRPAEPHVTPIPPVGLGPQFGRPPVRVNPAAASSELPNVARSVPVPVPPVSPVATSTALPNAARSVPVPLPPALPVEVPPTAAETLRAERAAELARLNTLPNVAAIPTAPVAPDLVATRRAKQAADRAAELERLNRLPNVAAIPAPPVPVAPVPVTQSFTGGPGGRPVGRFLNPIEADRLWRQSPAFAAENRGFTEVAPVPSRVDLNHPSRLPQTLPPVVPPIDPHNLQRGQEVSLTQQAGAHDRNAAAAGKDASAATADAEAKAAETTAVEANTAAVVENTAAKAENAAAAARVPVVPPGAQMLPLTSGRELPENATGLRRNAAGEMVPTYRASRIAPVVAQERFAQGLPLAQSAEERAAAQAALDAQIRASGLPHMLGPASMDTAVGATTASDAAAAASGRQAASTERAAAADEHAAAAAEARTAASQAEVRSLSDEILGMDREAVAADRAAAANERLALSREAGAASATEAGAAGALPLPGGAARGAAGEAGRVEGAAGTAEREAANASRLSRAGTAVRGMGAGAMDFLGSGTGIATVAIVGVMIGNEIRRAVNAENSALAKGNEAERNAAGATGPDELRASASDMKNAAVELRKSSAGFFGWLTNNIFNGDATGHEADTLNRLAGYQNNQADREAADQAKLAQTQRDASGAIDLTSPDNLTNSLTVLSNSGHDAADELDGLIKSMNAMADAAQRGTAYISPGAVPLFSDRFADTVGRKNFLGEANTLDTLSRNNDMIGGNDSTLPKWVTDHGLVKGFVHFGEREATAAGDTVSKIPWWAVPLTGPGMVPLGVGKLLDHFGFLPHGGGNPWKDLTGGGANAPGVYNDPNQKMAQNIRSIDFDALNTDISKAAQDYLNGQGFAGGGELDKNQTDELKRIARAKLKVQFDQLAKDGKGLSDEVMNAMYAQADASVDAMSQSANFLDASKMTPETRHAALQFAMQNWQQAGQIQTNNALFNTPEQTHGLMSAALGPKAAKAKYGDNQNDMQNVLGQPGSQEQTLDNGLNYLEEMRAAAVKNGATPEELTAFDNQIKAVRAQLAPVIVQRLQADAQLANSVLSPLDQADQIQNNLNAIDAALKTPNLDKDVARQLLILRGQTVQQQHSYGEDTQKAQWDNMVGVGDDVGAAYSNVLDANNRYNQDYAGADAQNKAKLETNKRNAIAAFNKSAMEREQARKATLVDPRDSLGQATQAVTDDQAQIAYLKQYEPKNLTERYKAEAKLASDLVAQDKERVAAAHTAALLTLDMTNPAQMAQQELKDAQDKLAKDQADKTLGKGDPAARKRILNEDTVDVRNKQSAAEEAAFNQEFDHMTTADQLGEISHSAYMRYLEGKRDRVKKELAAMKETDQGFFQKQQDLDKLNTAIKGINDSLQGQFNIGQIDIPTVYEMRRTFTAGQADQGYSDNRVVTITVNGGNSAEVLSVIKSELGTTAQSRRAPTTLRRLG